MDYMLALRKAGGTSFGAEKMSKKQG